MSGSPPSSRPTNWRDFVSTLRFLLAVVVLGAVLTWFQTGLPGGTAGFVALASTAAGAVVGFLFGIPKVLQHDAPLGQPAAGAAAAGGAAKGAAGPEGYRMQVNTNLEQISDWLTKIIVGVGLIQLRAIPGALESLATRVAPRNAGQETIAMTGALIIAFVIVGFFSGYLLTRLYLARAFREADLAASISVGGRELSIEEASAQLRAAIGDLQDHVLTLQTARTGDEPAPEGLTAQAKERGALPVRSILWVDDNPTNNSLLIERLTKLGIQVVTSLSTDDALAKLRERTFDRIISDMGRQEDRRYNPTAGVELVRKIRATDPKTPIVIHCSAEASAKYRELALDAGADEVTPSQTRLMQALRLDDPAYQHGQHGVPARGSLGSRPSGSTSLSGT